MKILLVNTSGNTGGAAIAASRLATTLQNHGIYAKMLVTDNGPKQNSFVVSLPGALMHKWNFLIERLGIFARQDFKKKHLFDIDPATHGTDITRLPEFKEADVIHLHWVNQGFLSLKDIRKILKSGKPVVWTMHDMWTFTGICHYVRECTNYKKHCGNCPLLAHNGPNDFSHKIWLRKQKIWNEFPKLTFVACSKWLAQVAIKSPLIKGHQVLDIVNPIDCNLYTLRPKSEAREKLHLPTKGKTLILFCAYNVNLPIKGLKYLKKALEILTTENPSLRETLGVILAGKGSDTAGGDFPVDTFPMGFVSDERKKALIYNASDMFVIPSLQDNLPNTIVEAKASGLPVIGTKVGGIPQMINHQNDGYLIEPQNSADLARAIKWLVSEADINKISAQSRANAQEQYSETSVARKYIELYENLLQDKQQQH